MAVRFSSNDLESFLAVAREQSVYGAAERLHVTQSALSRRIQALEQKLDAMLFLRTRSGVELTDQGLVLLRHCERQRHQEREVLGELTGGASQGLVGNVRIAGFSSCVRSVLMPCLAPLLRQHQGIAFQFVVDSVRRLPDLLIEGQADFSVSLAPCERAGVQNIALGIERNVLIESTRYTERNDTYIDHDPRDNFTELFFQQELGQSLAQMRRSYSNDIYGLIDAVALGIGRAVVPVHLIRPWHQVRRVPGFGVLEMPVVLHFHTQPYYTRLLSAIREALVVGTSEELAQDPAALLTAQEAHALG